jgi:hypothetical protein
MEIEVEDLQKFGTVSGFLCHKVSLSPSLFPPSLLPPALPPCLPPALLLELPPVPHTHTLNPVRPRHGAARLLAASAAPLTCSASPSRACGASAPRQRLACNPPRPAILARLGCPQGLGLPHALSRRCRVPPLTPLSRVPAFRLQSEGMAQETHVHDTRDKCPPWHTRHT